MALIMLFSVRAGRIRRPRKGLAAAAVARALRAPAASAWWRGPRRRNSRRDAWWRRTRWQGMMIGIGLLPLAWPDRARTAAGGVRDVEVAARRAVRDRAQCPPDALLVRRAGGRQRQVELGQLAVEIRVQLLACATQQATSRSAGCPSPNRRRRWPRPPPRRRCRRPGYGAKAVARRCKCQRRRARLSREGRTRPYQWRNESIIRSPPNFPCVCLAMTRGTI